MNFDWAARENAPLGTSEFIVRWNGEDIADHVPTNYNINHFKGLVLAGRTNELKLIGGGQSDSLGATVANFAIYKVSQNDGYPGFVYNPEDLPITYVPSNIFSTINNLLLNGDF